MAASDSEESTGETTVLKIFEDGMAIFDDLSKSSEATNSNSVQVQIKRAMRLFEDATRLVSIAGIFSTNENIEEVATRNIRYFLLPALLGTLSLKLCVDDRANVVKTAEVYFRDFLKRCRNYEIITTDIPEPKESSSEQSETACRPCATDLAGMVQGRNAKIQRFREQKELEAQLEELKKSLTDLAVVDEEIERKYYLTLIKNYASQAVDELNSIEMEKPLLEHMAKVRKEESFAGSNEKLKKSRFPPPKPLQPIIITRDEIQKKVFGAGYPSLPTLTVQEFYEKRIRDGDWPDPSKQPQHSLKNWATSGSSSKEENEEIEKEQKIENDDAKSLQDARDWDEYKDDHRRGWGNRMNRS